MAGFGAECRRYLKRLHKAGANVTDIIAEAAETATIAAVETAAAWQCGYQRNEHKDRRNGAVMGHGQYHETDGACPFGRRDCRYDAEKQPAICVLCQ